MQIIERYFGCIIIQTDYLMRLMYVCVWHSCNSAVETRKFILTVKIIVDFVFTHTQHACEFKLYYTCNNYYHSKFATIIIHFCDIGQNRLIRPMTRKQTKSILYNYFATLRLENSSVKRVREKFYPVRYGICECV